jgi:hypothetical protein
MGKLTPEQKERQREGLRRYNANRTPEEIEAHKERMRRINAQRTPEQKKAAVVKRYITKRKQAAKPLRGRLTAAPWLYGEYEDDL